MQLFGFPFHLQSNLTFLDKFVVDIYLNVPCRLFHNLVSIIFSLP